VTDDEQLVPSARLGAALHRARLQSGATLAGLARASEQRFLPDQLVWIERGEVPLTDDDIRALAALYELPARPWAAASTLDLVLDRATMSAVDAPISERRRRERSRSESLEWIASRFIALSVLTGIDVTSGPIGLEMFAEAIESSLDFAVNLLGIALERDSERIGRMISEMEERVIVPQVGFLVGEMPAGELLLVGHGAPDGDDAILVPACGTLDELLAAAR
jgi:hypothetical protein